ncbi:hypothetical protein M2323_002749 [Rhodoblastus acidophilus]|uniref:hypothetical protein n=1 Tax=Rhodoblastus acidophilus TaxID=1074 RepID=UPI0022255CDC|nr:hypothetical protein [Rhodoblastus acidophilus]MCW2284897.1 hypothetical protein [Rhodoblastus acidophilus]MCW2333813.1 hypothetical protein [Rhodoblastus acidophilus]
MSEFIDNASALTAEHFRDALAEIERQFGRGYALKNPALVGQYLGVLSANIAAETRRRRQDEQARMGQR